MVQGIATDAESALVSLVVDEVELLDGPPSPSEPFEVAIVSRSGLRVIVASATDACGNRREVAHPFLLGPSYAEPATAPAPGATTASGIGAQPNQAGLYDGSYGEDFDDVVDVVGKMLRSFDLDA